MDKRKEYLILLFMKKSSLYNSISSSINTSFKLLKNTYPDVNEEKIEELKKKFSIDEYIKQISPIIDEYFSEEELQEITKFYSFPPGNKLIDKEFLNKIKNISNKLFLKTEEDFKRNNV